VGEEAGKTYKLRLENGFIDTYLSGEAILDIGYKGYIADVVPIVPQATGVELDFPGYDGRTLPFAEESQDAVFASHCLEHIPDFRNALQDWFRVLRTGGFLVIMVPHQFLYEKRVALPSQYNDDHQRFYTPASLMAEIEGSLAPNSYRLRHLADNDLGYDYSIPPERHSDGCYELELVVEKIEAPDWALATRVGPYVPRDNGAREGFDAIGTGTTQDVVAEREAGTQRITTLAAEPHDLALYDFGREAGGVRHVLAMTLGHFGDFIIGLPALRRLRAAFPDARIRLIVGAWNRVAAETCDLVDEVATYNYFPENARNWDGRPVQGMDTFRAAAAGVFDVAIDLRVDEDTRHLLEEVDAVTRCGIGISARFPFLDVVLPFDHSLRLTDGLDRVSNVLLGPERFDSRMPRRTPFRHDTDFSVGDTHVIYGPYIKLPPGRFRATFGLQLSGLRFGLKRTRITVDVAHNGSDIVAACSFTADQIAPAINDGVQVDFVNNYEDGTFEFRVHTSGRPLRATMGFSGVRLDQLEAPAAARFRRSDLHIGEQLSLLVQLLADRTNELYPMRAAQASPEEPDGGAGRAGGVQAGAETGTPSGVAEMLNALPQGRYRVVIAPVSNSDLRDWPVAHYVSLVRALVERLDCVVLLVGSRAQTKPLDNIVQESGCVGRVVNLAGRTAWSEMPAVLRKADLVICNNSGIGHLAASLGAPTLAIYSASHQPQEWGPRGPHSQALMAVVPCSPCGYDRLSECPYEHACMQGLLPESVFAQAAGRLAA
jgi:ADP-heptose:LPS heptosyltransferase/SAM-dependent methyltransferase